MRGAMRFIGMFGLLFENRRGTRQEMDQIVLLFGLAFLCQTAFINDYPVRKMVILLPFILYLILYILEFVFQRIKGAFPVTAALMLIVVLVFDAGPTYEDVVAGRSESMKGAMISLKDIGDAETIGGLSHSFRLYNQTRPYLNSYIYNYREEDLKVAWSAMSGQMEGVVPQYTVQVMIDDTIDAEWIGRGYVADRTLLDGHEEGVGRVVLYRWVGKPQMLANRVDTSCESSFACP
jgi:hypothetical protein